MRHALALSAFDLPAEHDRLRTLTDSIEQASRRHAHQAARTIMSSLDGAQRAKDNSYVMDVTSRKIDAAETSQEIRTAQQAVEFLRSR